MTRSSIWDVDRARTDTPPFRIWPGAVCDNPACRRFDYTPIVARGRCYWCFAGTFTHRSSWSFAWCPACDGEGPFCSTCHGKRIVAAPAAP